MHPCTICGLPYLVTYHCTKTHQGQCHGCAQMNLREMLGYYDHEPPAAGALSPRDVAAIVEYQRHVVRTVGSEALRDMMLEEPS